MSAEPFAEVLGTPFGAWLGALGTPMPEIDDTEDELDAGWLLLGTNGIDNQGSTGVVTSLAPTITDFTPAGGSLPVKSWITDEKGTVAFSLVDLTVEMFAAVRDQAAISTVSASTGHAGKKSISLMRGARAVTYFALLVRGLSPYDDGTGLMAQYLYSRVYQSGTQAPTHLKGTPAELACEFTIAGTVTGEDPALYEAQTAARL